MGGMKKRYETTSLRSSSLRQDSVSGSKATQQITNVGCMSGILRLVSKYHTRRKFLTFGKKHDRETTTTPSQKSKNATRQSVNQKRLSSQVNLEIPRSPIIPPEIRLPPRMPSLHDDIPTRNTTGEMVVSEVAEEKRRKLLGALEKCDEDLQELKRIILAVRGEKTPPPTPPSHGGVGKRDEDEEEEVGSDEPSPISVLDCHQLVDRSPTMSYSKWTRQDNILQHQHQKMQQQEQLIRQIDYDNNNNTILHVPDKPYASRRLMVSTALQSKTRPPVTESLKTQATSRWSSETKETVIEVCKAVEWGQKREIGSLVLVVHDIIFSDLVDEIIKDMELYQNSNSYACSLPHEARKRKLSF